MSVLSSVECPIMESIAIKMLFKKRRGTTIGFQSKRKDVLVPCSSRYASSRRLQKFVWNLVEGVWTVIESVDGSDNVSGRGKEVSEKFLLGNLQGWVCLGKICASSNALVFVINWVNKVVFTKLFRSRC